MHISLPMSVLATCNIAIHVPSHMCHMQELKKMRAACKLGAEVREFAGTLVKVGHLHLRKSQTSASPVVVACMLHCVLLDPPFDAFEPG